MKVLSKNNRFSLALPGMFEDHQEDYYVLSGDVGDTKTNLAICTVSADGLNEIVSASYASRDFGTLVHIIQDFLQQQKIIPKKLTLGVAGPVIHGKADLTNLGWILDCEDLKKSLEIENVFLLNDLEATAYGLADLEDNELELIHKGDATIGGNMAILAPGTGLGEAGLYYDGKSYHPFPTEGGHCDFSPRTEFDIQLLKYLQNKYGIVSWEKAVSGPAIADIFHFIHSRKALEIPGWIKELFDDEDDSAVISRLAIEEKDAVCMETMDHFIRFLARECSNLALKMKSTGGLFLGGGIPPKILPLIRKQQFMDQYLDGDRMEDLLVQVPIRVILESETAMMGAAYFAAYGKW